MNWKVIGKSLKNNDMRKRLLAVVGMIIVFRFMAHIPIPIAQGATLKQILETLFKTAESSQLLGLFNVLSGGALAKFSIMLVGLGPYINASIIMQLLTKAIPKLEELNKEGEFGRKKIQQYTRILTFPLAIIQSIGAIYLVKQTASSLGGLGDITANASLEQWILMVASLVGGSMILMWLGELITEQGVGNGISLIITVGIVSQLPARIGSLLGSIYDKNEKWTVLGQQLPINKAGLIYAALVSIATLLITIFVVKLNEAARNITINYAKRVQGNKLYGGVTSILPIKLITAGVIPIIFALAFLSIPSFVGQILSGSANVKLQGIGTNLVAWFQPSSAQTFAAGGWQPYIYPLVYFLLVFIFTYFYTSITFSSQEIAENLQKQGGFIANIRSGLQTEKYLSKTVNRLTFFGALSLGFLALLPILAQIFIKTDIALQGTSILILVAVSIETLRQIESRALMVTYDQYDEPDYFTKPLDQPKRSKFSKNKLTIGKSRKKS